MTFFLATPYKNSIDINRGEHTFSAEGQVNILGFGGSIWSLLQLLSSAPVAQKTCLWKGTVVLQQSFTYKCAMGQTPDLENYL